MKKEKTVGNIGAINALKGYRVQALYSLARILNPTLTEYSFVPEGYEDLDVLDADGKHLEVIQIKNTTTPLVLSNLVSKEGTSFFKRCIGLYKNGLEPKLTVTTFGAVGPELQSLFTADYPLDDFCKRFNEYGFTRDELDFLKTKTQFIIKDETEVKQKAIDHLKSSGLVIDPDVAIDLLHFWMYLLSEKGGQITSSSLVAKLSDIGKFVNERQQFNEHFHNTITSFETRNLDTEEVKSLAEGYYQGIGARYEHIVADLDIQRPEKLQLIQDKIDESHIVIVHGASGQGKSTIALRFIHSIYPYLTFEIRALDDAQKTLEQIQALKVMAKALELPVLIYIDVEPGYHRWTTIVKEFGDTSAFRFLITIREEDWNRSPNKGVDFRFAEIDLAFDESEAREVYARLCERLETRSFTDFDEAWLKFGGQGPLMEFTYLVNQGESLRERLRTQLSRIEQDNQDLLDILRLACFAHANGGKIKVKALSGSSVFARLRFAVEIFEREFLIRFSDNEKFLLGLHPIRSQIITELVHDFDLLATEQQTAVDCLPLIDERDLYFYVLNVYHLHPTARAELLLAASEYSHANWLSVGNLLKALLWVGVEQFVESHRAFLEDIRSWDEALLFFKIAIDIGNTGMNSGEFTGIDALRSIIDKMNAHVSKHKVQGSEIFDPLRSWLKALDIKTFFSFNEPFEAEACGLLLFWTAHMEMPLKLQLDSHEVELAVATFRVSPVSKLMFGLHQHEQGRTLARKLESQYIKRLRKEYKVAVLERGYKDKICAFFLVDLYTDFEDKKNSNAVHEIKLEIIDALRYGLPYLGEYGTKGHGHKFTYLSLDLDDSVSSIPIKNLPNKLLTELNSPLSNLFFYLYRPETWSEYVNLSMQVRTNASIILRKMVKLLNRYIKTGALGDLTDFQFGSSRADIDQLLQAIPLPKTASDWTGHVSEENRKSNSITGTKDSATNERRTHLLQTLVLKKFNDYLEAEKEYRTSLINFLWQSQKIMHENQQSNDDLRRVSTVNLFGAYKLLKEYQQLFHKHFSGYVEHKMLKRIEKEEQSLLQSLVYGWKLYLSSNRMEKSQLEKAAPRKFVKTMNDFRTRLTNTLKKTQDEIVYPMPVELLFDESRKSLILTVDVFDPMDLFEAVIMCCHAMFESVKKTSYTSIKYLLLDTNYPNFIVIPTVLGRTLSENAYEFPLHVFLKDGIEDLKPYYFQQKGIDPEIFSELGLEMHSEHLSGIKEAQEFLQAYGELTVNVGTMNQISRLIEHDEADALSKEILTEYSESAKTKAEGLFLSFHDHAVNQLKRFEDDSIKMNEEESAYFHKLKDAFYKVLPAPSKQGEDEYKVTLGADEIEEWFERLTDAAEDLQQVFLYLLKLEIHNLAPGYKI